MPFLLPAAATAVAGSAAAAGTAISMAGAAATAAGAAGAVAAGAATATASATLASIATNIALNVGISAVMSALQPKVGAAGRTSEWSLDPDGPIPFAAGRIGVAGSAVYRKTFGPDLMYYGIPSVVSGAGPIDGYETFRADDEFVTFDANGKAITSQYANELWFKKTLGAQPDVALTSPAGLKNSAALPGWTTAHKLSGKAAYMIVMAENSKGTAYPTGEIKPLVVVRGLKGWDPRLDSTYPGGAGACRLSNPSTWVYLTNPALWALKWALGLWEDPVGKGAPQVGTQVGGIGAKLSGIDVPAFVSAANIADANGWTVCAYPTTGDDKAAVLDSFLQAAGCIYAQRAGKISCIQRAAPRASIVTITAADTAGALEVDTAASRIDRINTIRPRINSEAHRWQLTAIPEVTATSYREEDGGTRPRGIDFTYVSNATQAAQLAALQIANTREGIAGFVPLKPHLQKIKPGDAFTITEPGFVLDGLKCLCLNTEYDPATKIVTVTFVSETDEKYPFALGQTSTPPAPPVLTPETYEVTPPQAGEWSLAAVDLTEGGVSVPILLFTGDVENARAESVVFEYRPVGSAQWSLAGSEDPTVVRKEVAGGALTAGTEYEGAVSYRIGGRISDRLTLGPVTAGTLTAGGVTPVTPANVAGTPSIAITVGHDGDGTAVNLLAADWTDAANALSYVVELEAAGVSRLIDAPESSLSNVRVQAGQACRYRVKGKSRTGHLSAAWSAWSALQTAAGDTTAPGVVTSPILTPLARRIIVSWTNPADADLDGVNIARHTATTATPQNYVIARKVRGTVFPDTNVSAATAYHYYAQTVDRSGNAGAWTYLGVEAATFIRVDLGDINPTDPTIVTGYGISSGFTGQTAWATLGLPTARLNYLDNSGNLSGLDRVTDRAFTHLSGRTADNLTYVGGGGGTVESLRPGEAGANVTETRIATGITGQGAFATLNRAPPSRMDGLDGDNLILDPLFADAAYWTRESNRFQIVSGDAGCIALNVVRAMAVQAAGIVGDVQAIFYNNVGTGLMPVRAVRTYRPSARYYVPAGFNGWARLLVYWVDRTGTSKPAVTVAGADFRTSPAAANTTAELAGTVTAPADAQYCYVAVFLQWPGGVASAGGLWAASMKMEAVHALSRNVAREDGLTLLTDNTAVTSLGVASGITGQAAWATYSAMTPTQVATPVATYLSNRSQSTVIVATGAARWHRVARVSSSAARGAARVTLSFDGGGYTPSSAVLDVASDWNTHGGSITVVSNSVNCPIIEARLSKSGSEAYLDVQLAAPSNSTNFTIGVDPINGTQGVWAVHYLDGPTVGTALVGTVPLVDTSNGARLTGTMANGTSTLTSSAGGVMTNGVRAVDAAGVGFDVQHGAGRAVLERGANITETRVASGITNQAAWATYTTHAPVNIAPRVATGLNASGQLVTGLHGGGTTALTVPEIFNGIGGTQLNANPEFAGGSMAGYTIYDNGTPPEDRGKTVLSITSGQTPNGTGHRLTIAYDGAGAPGANPAPGFGGYVMPVNDAGSVQPSRVGHYARGSKLLFKIMAYIPAGRNIEFASNSIGTGSAVNWLTSTSGTGGWQLYECLVTIGATGTFSSTGYFYVKDGSNVAFTWYVARHDVIDITSTAKTNLSDLRRVSDGTPQTDTTVITGLGVASGITGQGTGATASTLAQLNPGEGSHLAGIAPKAGTTVALVAMDVHSVIQGNTVTKGAENSGYGTGGVYSRDAIAGSAYVSARHGGASSLFGLADSSSPTSTYHDIAFAVHFSGGPTSVYAYESGTQMALLTTTGVATDVWAVAYDGVSVRYLQNGVVRRTVAVAAGRVFRAQASLPNANSSKLTDITFGPNAQVARLGQNTYRHDTGALVPQAEIRTPEGVASGISGQTAWATYTAHAPADVAPRVVAGLDSNGDLSRNLTVARLDGSNVLRRAAGGLYAGDLNATVGARAGTNLFRTDGATVMTQAEVRTPEGIASGISGQSNWATYTTHAPADIAPRVATGLASDGRLVLPTLSDGSEIKNTALQTKLEEGAVRPLVLAPAASVMLGASVAGKVQAQSFKAYAGDGEAVNFGVTYEVPPIVLVASLDNVLFGDFGAGDYLRTEPVNVTTSGFTGRARRRNNGSGGTPTARVDDGAGDATAAGAAQVHYRHKETAGVAANETYQATFSYNIRSGSIGGAPGSEGYEVIPRTLTIGFYGRTAAGGAWTLLGQTSFESDPSSAAPETRTGVINGMTNWAAWPIFAGSGNDGYEYKVEVIGPAQGGCSIQSFTSVTWTELVGASGPVDVTALPAGGKLVYLVIPQAL